MTRINLVPPSELSKRHLVAEYREIMRLPGNLQKSINRKDSPFTVEEIPSEYTLGKGHVKFFYNKMTFLRNRFEDLVKEMVGRGYKPTFTDLSIFSVGEEWMGDYTPTPQALKINRKRIKDRS